MPELSLSEVILATTAFVAAALMMFVGYITRGAAFWRWVDILYYPIGIFGIVLLFISSDNSRKVIDLQKEALEAAEKSTLLDRLKPEIGSDFLPMKLLQSSYDLAMSIPNLAKSCQDAASIDIKCLSARSIGPSIAKNISNTPWPDENDRDGVLRAFQEYCGSLDNILKSLRSVDPFMVDKFYELYNEASAKNFNWMQSEATKEYRERFLSSFDSVKKLYGDTTFINDTILMKDLFDQELKDFGSIFYAFEICIRVPDSIRKGVVLSYEREVKDQNTYLANKLTEIKNISRYNEKRLFWAAFVSNIWPYVIVSALALKCGKATAVLSGDDWREFTEFWMRRWHWIAHTIRIR